MRDIKTKGEEDNMIKVETNLKLEMLFKKKGKGKNKNLHEVRK